MRAIGIVLIAGVLSLAHVTLVQAVEPVRSGGSSQWGGASEHGFYVGLAFGPTQLSTADGERSMDGLNIRFETQDDDVGISAFAGYWISDNVGIEVATRDYGKVMAAFEFSNPHDGTAGTGESEVSIRATSIALMLGYDIVDSLQVYARVGAQMWEEDFDSRFDIPGEPAINRTTEDSGTGVIYGGGVSWRFHRTWQLHLQYDHAELGDDEMGMGSLALSYDFIGLVE